MLFAVTSATRPPVKKNPKFCSALYLTFFSKQFPLLPKTARIRERQRLHLNRRDEPGARLIVQEPKRKEFSGATSLGCCAASASSSAFRARASSSATTRSAVLTAARARSRLLVSCNPFAISSFICFSCCSALLQSCRSLSHASSDVSGGRFPRSFASRSLLKVAQYRVTNKPINSQSSGAVGKTAASAAAKSAATCSARLLLETVCTSRNVTISHR
jgi:hypothetical protein